MNKECELPKIEKLTPEIIRFNYYPGGLLENMDERWEERIVGQKGITKICEHAAQGDGDKWYWDVHYENNQVERIFNPHLVFYAKEMVPVGEQEFIRIDTTTKAIVP